MKAVRYQFVDFRGFFISNLALESPRIPCYIEWLFFPAFGDFIFLRAQKNEAKKGRPCGGLAQRKSFVRTYKGWRPSGLDG